MEKYYINKACFLDKDGTIVKNVPYNSDPALVELTEGTSEALEILVRAGFMIVVISNQSGVAKGFFTLEKLKQIEKKINVLLLDKGGEKIEYFFYCPHSVEGSVKQYTKICYCRKPQPGLLFQAQRKLKINLACSWMIGDILNDVEAGKRAGTRTILLDTGNETKWDQKDPLRVPDFQTDSLKKAAEFIINFEERPKRRSEKFYGQQKS